jgi:sialate O-acetylesterase
MAQWSPEKRDEGGASLYGALLARVKSVGGRIAGILWYQGESDANPDDAANYHRNMLELVQELRQDIGQFDLPFYYVQIGRVVMENVEEPAWDPKGWNLLREAQRTLLGKLPHSAMVSAIDLELDDLIHIGTNGLKRLGQRLADVADGLASPILQTVTLEEEGRRIRIAFQQVRGDLQAQGRPTGFSLRSSQGTAFPIIYKQTLEENCVLLHLTTVVPSNSELWYGWGLNPYCNITDGADAAIPAFGPVVLA